MNNCSFIGRIAQDLELKRTNNGLDVCSFSIAVDRPGSKERETDFIPVVAWRKTAEFICRYFKKGQKIGVTGMMTARKWEDKHKQKRVTLELVVDRVCFCEKSEGSDDTQPAAPTAAYNLTPASQMGNFNSSNFEEVDEDDLPF